MLIAFERYGLERSKSTSHDLHFLRRIKSKLRYKLVHICSHMVGTCLVTTYLMICFVRNDTLWIVGFIPLGVIWTCEAGCQIPMINNDCNFFGGTKYYSWAVVTDAKFLWSHTNVNFLFFLVTGNTKPLYITIRLEYGKSSCYSRQSRTAMQLSNQLAWLNTTSVK